MMLKLGMSMGRAKWVTFQKLPSTADIKKNILQSWEWDVIFFLSCHGVGHFKLNG